MPSAEVISERSAAAKIDQEAIALLAYSFWESRGGVGGSAADDWCRAERELLALAAAAKS